jgi:putative acetyltransferase
VAQSGLVIEVDDPRADDVRALLAVHLAYAEEVTPPGHVHAIAVDGLADEDVLFFSARRDDELVGVAALRHLDDTHVEVKSMHVAAAARGAGVGRSLAEHLLGVAVARGYRRASLETGTYEAFAAARALYSSVGFRPCAPFAEYPSSPYSTCMTISLPRRAGAADGEAVADVWLRSRRASEPAIPPPVHTDDEVREWLDSVVVDRETWVIEEDGAVVALLVLDGGWVDQLYVDPACTGRRLGSRLMALAKARCPSGLDLWTFQANVGAIRFYAHHGFVEVGRTDGDNEEGAPDLRMRWSGQEPAE